MAQPPLLSLQGIALTFGGTPLLENADFMVSPRERLCLVGRNGSGKSTLLKIAAGLIEPDEGEIFRQPGTTIRYLPQEPDLSAYDSVRAYIETGLEGADTAYKIPYLLESVGLTGDEDPAKLSGGEQRRAALVRTLAPEPDILMLDEPTNHLDLPAIEWLEAELSGMNSAIVLISHDRRFLENLSRQTVWIDRGQTKTLNKGFGAFEDWRDTLMEQEELERHKLDRKIVREQHWVVHGVSGRRKRNVKRLKDLAGLRQQRKEARGAQSNVSMSVAGGQTSGKRVARLKHVTKAFGERVIVDDFSALIARGDRIGVIGPNGAGKTTLLKLIMGQLEPDSGTVELGVNLEPLVLDQKRETLDPDWTLKDAISDGNDTVDVGGRQLHVMRYMKDFLFTPEQARTPVGALSGGERGRLGLARGLRLPSNLLVLDEPTNDLDLETLDLLQEMIADYKGTVLVVSHDRDFLDRTVTSTIAFEGNGRWVEYPGGYSDMVSQRGHGVQKRKQEKAAKSKTGKPGDLPDTLAPKSKGKLTFKDKHALETLPQQMDAVKNEIAAQEAKMADPEFYSRDPDGFNIVVEKLGDAQSRLDEMEEQWLEL